MIISDTEDSVHYHKLKVEILRAAGTSYDLDKIKRFFEDEIDSVRDLEQVHDLRDMIQLLECRDMLSEINVSALKCIGQLLCNRCIESFAQIYIKMYQESANPVCSCCGMCLTIYHFNIDILNEELMNTSSDPVTGDGTDELSEAIRNISLQIGKEWCTLYRELATLPECHIDEIRAKYPNDYCMQAQKAFELWRQHEKENATIEKLDLALNARLCKRRGLGSHLRNPIITL